MMRNTVAKPLGFFIGLYTCLLKVSLLGWGQSDGMIGEATSNPPAGEAMRNVPPGTTLDLSNLGAKIVFLVFIAIFVVMYLFIRRQPTSKELKKLKKKKR